MATDTTNVAIEIKGLSKRFYLRQTKRVSFFKSLMSSPEYFRRKDELWALKDLSLEVPEGECVGIIGLNGSGKSTLLRLIEGVYLPTKGEISIKYDTSLLQLGLGFNPELSVFENVFLHGAVMGISRRKLEDNFEDIINFAELGDFVGAKLRTLSSGMVQRLAFSTTIQTDSRILLLDEVFSVGDERFVNKCVKVMDDFKREGRTLLLASHDRKTIINTCAKVLLLHRGGQAYYGPPKDALEKYDKLLADLNGPGVGARG